MGVASGAGWWSEERDNLVTKEDPGFVDFQNHNFELHADSKALRELPAFQPPPFAKMGLYRDEYTPHLQSDKRPGAREVRQVEIRTTRPRSTVIHDKERRKL
ncbi:MAG: hypothetical protein NTV49_09975 [Kiritimatiellaeota bacterium]|nr:hypothetical protein [Kiritimatiellota bacterium]